MALLSLKTKCTVGLVCVLLGACNVSPRASKAASDFSCRGLGKRLHSEQISGIIYGDIKTRVHIAGCADTEMAIAFIDAPPKPYLSLQDRASSTTGMIGFKANADGFIVEESDRQYTFIVLTLENIVEDKNSVGSKAQ